MKLSFNFLPEKAASRKYTQLSSPKTRYFCRLYFRNSRHDSMFTFLARLILKNRILMLVLLFAATIFMGWVGSGVKVGYNFSRILPTTDTTQIEYDWFRENFGQAGNTVVLAAENVDVFQPENFQKWKLLERNLDTIKGVSNILSPVSAYELRRNDSLQKLEVVPFSKNYSEENVAELGELYENLPFYKDLLYSKDGRSPLMLVSIKNEQLYDENIVRIVEGIKVIIADFEAESGYTVHASGLPYIRMANIKKVSREVFTTVGYALLVTFVLMLFFMRSFKATFITMLTVILGVVWTFGLINGFGFPISMLSSLIPSLIIVIGVPNCIFLINKYHNEYKDHQNQILAIQRVIKKIGSATFLTNLTTALGFAALMFADSELLQEFGAVASVNILIVFLISIILIPIYYSYSNNPKPRHYLHLDKTWLQGFIDFLEKTVVVRRKWVYLFLGIFIVLGFYGASLMKTTGNLTEEYKDNDPLLLDLKYLEANFGGSVPLEILINTNREGGANKISFIKKLDDLQRELDSLPHLSRSLSVADGLKFANQGYYRGNPDFYKVPSRQEANFVLSYLPKGENGKLDMVEGLTDSTGQWGRITVQKEDLPNEQSEVLHAQVRSKIEKIFDPERYDYILTGASVVFLKGTDYLLKNLLVSLLIAIGVIAIIMALLFRSVWMVLLSLVPNLFPLLMTAGIMGYFGVPLKPSTLLVFSIAFGISVDDTIHYLAKYRQELRSNGWNIVPAVLASLRETGVSMFYTSVVLFFGFSVFATSSFGGIVSLGILISITLIIAMLANLIVLPTLLISFARRVANQDFDHPLITIVSKEDDEDFDTKNDKKNSKKVENL